MTMKTTDFMRTAIIKRNFYNGFIDPEDVRWMIDKHYELAERVQELEEDSRDATFAIDMLESENKRYREAIIEALHGLKTLPSVAPRLYLISILDKALEESK